MKRVLVIALLAAACGKKQQQTPSHPRGTSSVTRTSFDGARVASSGEPGGEGRKLPIDGLIVLGSAYVGTVIGGQIVKAAVFGEDDREVGAPDTVDKLWLPVFGPILAMDHLFNTVRTNCNVQHKFCDEEIAGAAVGIGFGGIAQLVGVAIIVGELVGDASAAPANAVTVAPFVTGEGTGFAVTGSF